MDTNTKDYGFPFVEPLKLEGKGSLENTIESEDSKSDSRKSENKKLPITEPFNTKDRSLEKPKKSKRITFFLIASILIILSVMAYFLYYIPKESEGLLKASIEVEKEEIGQVKEEFEELVSENFEEKASSDTVASPIITNESTQPNVGLSSSTNSTKGEITKVSSKSERPTYYIIIGSVPNESLANQESENYLSRGIDLWMILPNEESKNYRIASGKYTSFREASDALEPAKVQFGESIWILKY